MIPLVASHAPMLGRTLLYTALTRALRWSSLSASGGHSSWRCGNWRRSPRHTALGGLLDGTLRYCWERTSGQGDGQEPTSMDGWEALIDGDPDGHD